MPIVPKTIPNPDAEKDAKQGVYLIRAGMAFTLPEGTKTKKAIQTKIW